MAIGSALIGALRASLSLDTAAFEDGSKRASSQADRLAKNITRTIKGLGLGLILERTLASFKSVIDEADKLQETAQKIGIPTEELSKLSFAAEQTGTNLDSLTNAVGKLGRALFAALERPTGDAAEAFAALGLNIQQLAQLNASQQFAAVADAFQRIPDGFRQGALAAKLFGKSYAEVLPLLNQGAAAIEENGRLMEQLGAVISTRLAAQSDAFNDNISIIFKALDGMRIQILEQVMPALVRLSNQLVTFFKSLNIGDWEASSFSKFLINTIADIYRFNGFVEIAIKVVSAFSEVVNRIGTGTQLDVWEKLGDDISAINQRVAAEISILNNTLNSRGGVGGGRGGGVGNVGGGGEGGTEPPIVDLANKTADAYTRIKTNLTQAVEAMRTENQMMTLSAGARARLAESQRVYNALQDAGIRLTAAQTAEIEAQLNKIPALVEALELRQGVFSILQSGVEGLTDSLLEVVDGTKSLADAFKDMLNQILRDITRFLLNKALQQFLQLGFASFTGATAGPANIVPSGFGGGLATGGRVRSGRSFLVGERGPELFTPRTAGSVVPNSALGGGTQVTIIDQRTTQSAPIQSRQTGEGMEFLVRDTVRKELPSALSKTLPTQYGARPRLIQRGN